MSDVTWTDADAEAAEKEGWSIQDCEGSENGPWQIQSFDTPEEWEHAPDPYPFTRDADVWEHVAARAEEGSTLHQRALLFILKNNPTEAAAIRAWLNDQAAAAA